MDSFFNPRNYPQVDSRVAHLALVDSSYKLPLIIFAYVYFVLVCGPRFMKDKPPYSLKTFIQLYNIVQFVANFWLVYSFWQADLMTRELICSKNMEYGSPKGMRCVDILMGYFLLKLFDYMETVIFVLRKKNNQVSGLHVYHHVSTSFISWLFLRYLSIPPVAFVCVVNCFVHMIMYMYYFLSACGPSTQKIIAPMKRWITIIQMVQFCLLILYASQNFITYCTAVSRWASAMLIQNLLLNFYLFYNFYKKTYIKPKKIQ